MDAEKTTTPASAPTPTDTTPTGVSGGSGDNPAKKRPSSKEPQTQLEYWKEDLEIKRWQLRISFFGFLMVIIALYLNYRSSQFAGQSLKANTQLSMDRLVTDLDRVFIDHPEIAPYFTNQSTLTLSESDPNCARVYATATMMLDVLDPTSVQADQFKSLWRNPEGWEFWVCNSIVEVPVLNQVLRENTNAYPGLSEYLQFVRVK